MSEFDEPAWPTERSYGITIRQQAALMAMQGILASASPNDAPVPSYLAEWALDYADAVLQRERETRDE